MKFLLIVLIIRFVIELVSNKNKTIQEDDTEVVNTKIFHPSEYELR